MDKASALILNGTKAVDIVSEIIKARQDKDHRKTLSWLSKQVGLKSRSNLAEALQGKRSIKQERWRHLLDILELSKDQQDYILTLLDLEKATGSQVKDKLIEKLRTQRRLLECPFTPKLSKVDGMNFAHEVYCSFSLFKQRPTRDDIIGYFGRENYQYIDRALFSLIQEEMIVYEEPFYRQLNPLSNRLLKLYAKDNQSAETAYLKASLGKAERAMDHWYNQENLSFFGSAVVSVKRAVYETALIEFKKYILAKSLEMETDEADMLINVNVQIFPCLDAKRAVEDL